MQIFQLLEVLHYALHFIHQIRSFIRQFEQVVFHDSYLQSTWSDAEKGKRKSVGFIYLRKLSELRNLHVHDLNAANGLFEYPMKITKFAIAVAHLSTGAKKIFIDFLCVFMPTLLTLDVPMCMYECV